MYYIDELYNISGKYYIDRIYYIGGTHYIDGIYYSEMILTKSMWAMLSLCIKNFYYFIIKILFLS